MIFLVILYLSTVPMIEAMPSAVSKLTAKRMALKSS